MILLVSVSVTEKIVKSLCAYHEGKRPAERLAYFLPMLSVASSRSKTPSALTSSALEALKRWDHHLFHFGLVRAALLPRTASVIAVAAGSVAWSAPLAAVADAEKAELCPAADTLGSKHGDSDEHACEKVEVAEGAIERYAL